MKHLIIIGAGGMGRTMYSNALESIGFGETFDIKGFIDDNLNALNEYPNYPPVIATIKDYQPVEDAPEPRQGTGGRPAGDDRQHHGIHGEALRRREGAEARRPADE